MLSGGSFHHHDEWNFRQGTSAADFSQALPEEFSLAAAPPILEKNGTLDSLQ
jgi:hypothetical protein